MLFIVLRFLIRQVSLKFSIAQTSMHIYVHTADQRHTLEVDPTDRIGMVKAKLEEKTGRTLSDHHLLFQEAVMEDDRTLHACGVTKKDVLFISQVCRRNRPFVVICREILS